MQRRSIVFGLLFVLGLALIGWQEYYPSSGMFETMGMTGPTARSGRHCGHWWQRSIFGHRIPLRGINCAGPHIYSPDREFQEDVGVDGLTRKVQSARRIWSVEDSAGWVKQADSIRQSFARRGGRMVACPNRTSYLLPHIVLTEYWKFLSFYIRLNAYDWARTYPTPPLHSPRWLLQLDGYDALPEWCRF